MPSFSGITIALQAVLAHQQALEVIQHNVANASVPGYHRQEAVLRAGPTQGAPGLQASTLAGKVGTGVILQSIRRYSMDYMDSRYRLEQANLKRYDIETEFLKQVESALMETGTEGINAKLDAFWAGWKAVSTDPESTALRANLLEQGRGLARAFNGRMERLYEIQQDTNLKIIQNVQEINQLAEQVARLNREIGRYANQGMQPNDFLDEQAEYLDRFAELANAKIVREDNGQVMVSIGGHVLVQGISVHKLETVVNGANENMIDIRWEDGQYLYRYSEDNEYLEKYINSGELAGLFEIRDVIIRDEKDKLNELATTVFTNVNELHRQGFGLDDPTPVPDYVTYPGTGFPPGYPYPPDNPIGRDFFTLSDVSPQSGWLPTPPYVAAPPPPPPVTPPLDMTKIATLIRVNPELTARDVGAAQDPEVSGDGRIAEALFGLQTATDTKIYTPNPSYDPALYNPSDPTTFPYLDTGIVDNINHHNEDRVAELALTIRRIDTLSVQHKNLVDVMKQQRDSVNGVSLDEEAANMVKYQRSYQASIRMLTTVDEMLDRIINNMGLVGR
ncbi:MAG: flagellar hook-associated protein FlgK [Anaerolineae bacterium]|nr:flagellar hook-associated protein FlgK [Anaerolineae bacterium]